MVQSGQMYHRGVSIHTDDRGIGVLMKNIKLKVMSLGIIIGICTNLCGCGGSNVDNYASTEAAVKSSSNSTNAKLNYYITTQQRSKECLYDVINLVTSGELTSDADNLFARYSYSPRLTKVSSGGSNKKPSIAPHNIGDVPANAILWYATWGSNVKDTDKSTDIFYEYLTRESRIVCNDSDITYTHDELNKHPENFDVIGGIAYSKWKYKSCSVLKDIVTMSCKDDICYETALLHSACGAKAILTIEWKQARIYGVTSVEVANTSE